VAWYDGFLNFAEQSLSDVGTFVSQNVGTIVGGYLDYSKEQASAAASKIQAPGSQGNLPLSYTSSGAGGQGGIAAPTSDGFPLSTVLLIVGSVVVVALVFKK